MRVSSWLYLIEQTCMSAALLVAIGLCAGLRKRSLPRLWLTSAASALLSMAAVFFPAWLRVMLSIPAAAAAPLLSWPGVPRRMRLRMAMLGMLLSVMLTGVMRILAPLTLPGAIMLLIGCAALRAMPVAVTRASDPVPTTAVDIRIATRSMTLTALIDSGNLLRDTITGLPIIVISRRAAARLLPADDSRLLSPDGVLRHGLRLMPVRTISGTAMMTLMHPDSVRILLSGQWLESQALIGLCPDSYEGFQALIPACLVRALPHRHSPQQISQGG